MKAQPAVGSALGWRTKALPASHRQVFQSGTVSCCRQEDVFTVRAENWHGARDLSRRNAGPADPRWEIAMPFGQPIFQRTRVRAPIAVPGETVNTYRQDAGSTQNRYSPLGRGRKVQRHSITPAPEFARQPLAKHQPGACSNARAAIRRLNQRWNQSTTAKRSESMENSLQQIRGGWCHSVWAAVEILFGRHFLPNLTGRPSVGLIGRQDMTGEERSWAVQVQEVHKQSMNASGQPLLRLEGIKKIFLTDEIETHALAGIHLEINPGDYISIAGPSGCGKSTLLAILGLLDSPTEGFYTLNGQSVAELDHAERARLRNREIGFIFQSFNLIGDLTVFENVELPLTYRGMDGTERKKRVNEALERVGMAHRVRHYPAQLSGGQQQRVAVARALAGKPSILLADEPTGNLDSSNGEAVMALLSQLHQEGATICMVTHDPRFARHAGRIVNLFDGRVVEDTAIRN